MSRKHFRIEHDGQRWTLTDLESTHGTLVNNEKKNVAALGKNDIVFAGSTQFCITFGDHPPAVDSLNSASLRIDSLGIKYLLKSMTSKNFSYDATLGDSES